MPTEYFKTWEFRIADFRLRIRSSFNPQFAIGNPQCQTVLK